MRKAHEHFRGIVKDNYPGLPKELVKFNYQYPGETGRVIMAIPSSVLSEAEKHGDFEEFECPVPIKYILEVGYHMYNGYVVCDIEYDPVFGIMFSDEYFTY